MVRAYSAATAVLPRETPALLSIVIPGYREDQVLPLRTEIQTLVEGGWRWHRRMRST